MVACDLFVAIGSARLWESEAFVLSLTLEQLYGPQKSRTAKISPSEIERATGRRKQHIHRAVDRLLARGILGRDGDKFTFNKDYETWINPDATPLLDPLAVTFAQSRGIRQKPVSSSPVVTAVTTNGYAEEPPPSSPVVTAVTTNGYSRNHLWLQPRARAIEVPVRENLEIEIDDDDQCARDPERKPKTATTKSRASPSDLATWLRTTYPKHAADIEPALPAMEAAYPAERIREAIAATVAYGPEKPARYLDAVMRNWAEHPDRAPSQQPARHGRVKSAPPRKPTQPVPITQETIEHRKKWEAWIQEISSRNGAGNNKT